MDRPIFGFGDIKLHLKAKLTQGRASAGMRLRRVIMAGKMLQNGIKSVVNFIQCCS